MIRKEYSDGNAVLCQSPVEEYGGMSGGRRERLKGTMRRLLDSSLLCSLEWDTFNLQKAAFEAKTIFAPVLPTTQIIAQELER